MGFYNFPNLCSIDTIVQYMYICLCLLFQYKSSFCLTGICGSQHIDKCGLGGSQHLYTDLTVSICKCAVNILIICGLVRYQYILVVSKLLCIPVLAGRILIVLWLAFFTVAVCVLPVTGY